MKFLVIILFAAISASAQTDGLFYFAVNDGTGNKILPSKYWKISATIQDGDTLPLQYIKTDTSFAITLLPESFGKIVQLQLAYTAETYTGIMNVYFKSSDKNAKGACNTCAITNMEYRPGNFMLDLPYEEASWNFLEMLNCKINDNTLALKNISMLQNWSEPNMK